MSAQRSSQAARGDDDSVVHHGVLVPVARPVESLEAFSACFDGDAHLDLAELDAAVTATMEARHAANTRGATTTTGWAGSGPG